MAVYRWIYANADLEGDRGDYFVRLCDRGLAPFQDLLIRISNRLLSVERRQRVEPARLCWMAGFLDRERTIYLVAAGAEQGSLLHREAGKHAGSSLFCVLAYGFTGEDIRVCARETALFSPLLEYLRSPRRETSPPLPEQEDARRGNLPLLPEPKNARRECPFPTPACAEGVKGKWRKYNILRSTPQTDACIWAGSLERPAALGLFGTEDAARLISMFPNLTATVTGLEEDLRYEPVRPEKEKGKKLECAPSRSPFRKPESCPPSQDEKSQKRSGNPPKRPGNPERKAGKKSRPSRLESSGTEKKGMEQERFQEQVRLCWLELLPGEKRWIGNVCGNMKRKDLADYFLHFACLYLWMCRNGQQERAGELIDRTARETGGYPGLYYGYRIESGQDLVRLGRFWRASTQEKKSVMEKLNRKLAEAAGGGSLWR